MTGLNGQKIFAGFTLDEKKRRLVDVDGIDVTLTARAFDTLLFLIEHQGETVSKQAIMDAIWPGQVVEENNLNQAISTVRKALHDSENNRIILTIPGRGYSFVADIETLNEKDEPQLVPDSSPAESSATAEPASFIEELKRRHVIRVGVAYLVVSWLLLQITETMIDLLSLPDVIGRGIVMLLVIGFPLVLIAAWVFELTPKGIQTQEQADQSGYQAPASKLNAVVIGGLVIALILVVLGRSGDAPEAVQVSAESQSDPEAALGEPEKSIAVLPFTDLSPEGDQEYFADGLSDELLNKLAQVDDLTVISRTSTFYFKDRNESPQSIGEQLDVNYLLDGSVRKSEDQLRITAQLISVNSDTPLWSNTFDIAFSEIFAIQDEIAEAVTTALSITIGAGEFNRPGMTRNIEAFEAWLLSKSGGLAASLEQIDYAERAIELDPGFGLAWLSLERALGFSAYLLPPDQGAEMFERSGVAGTTAQALAPDALEMQLVKAFYLQVAFDWVEAEQQFLRILDQFGQSAIGALEGQAELIAVMGRPEEALPMLERAKRLDPLSRRVANSLARMLAVSGRFDESQAEMQRGLLLEENGEFTAFADVEMLITLGTGDISDLASLLSKRNGETGPDVQALRDGDINAALQLIRDGLEDPATPDSYKPVLARLAAKLGSPELALEILRENPGYAYGADSAVWMDFLSEMRQLPDFKGFVRDAGFYDYWVTTGNWADKCRPLEGGDDFECF